MGIRSLMSWLSRSHKVKVEYLDGTCTSPLKAHAKNSASSFNCYFERLA